MGVNLSQHKGSLRKEGALAGHASLGLPFPSREDGASFSLQNSVLFHLLYIFSFLICLPQVDHGLSKVRD